MTLQAAEPRGELVPLRTDFDLVLRGYDREQVRRYVQDMEAEVRLLSVDRDAAVNRADELTRLLEAARSEVTELRRRLDRVCRSPIEPDALTDRLRRMAELAHEEAAEITSRARAAAEHQWATAERAAARLRERHERLVAELDARRAQMETEHRELMRAANERIAEMTRQAERRRRELDDRAAALRKQVETDFELAMAARRAEAVAALNKRETEAKANADKLIRDARAQAERMVADARRQVAALHERRKQVAAELRAAERLLAEAAPLLDPLPDEAALDPASVDGCTAAVPEALRAVGSGGSVHRSAA